MKRDRHPRGEILQAFADAQLEAAEAAQVQAHCAACAVCRESVDGFIAVRELLAANADLPAAPHVWAGVAARLAYKRRPLGLGFAFGAAAACAVGLVLAIVIADGGSRATHSVGDASVQAAWQGGGSSLLDVFQSALPEKP